MQVETDIDAIVDPANFSRAGIARLEQLFLQLHQALRSSNGSISAVAASVPSPPAQQLFDFMRFYKLKDAVEVDEMEDALQRMSPGSHEARQYLQMVYQQLLDGMRQYNDFAEVAPSPYGHGRRGQMGSPVISEFSPRPKAKRISEEIRRIMEDEDGSVLGDDDDDVVEFATRKGRIPSLGKPEFPSKDPQASFEDALMSSDVKSRLEEIGKYSNYLSSREDAAFGDESPLQKLFRLRQQDASHLNEDVADSDDEDEQAGSARVQRLYEKLMRDMVPKPTLEQMVLLLYPSAALNRVTNMNVQQLIAEIAQGIVLTTNKARGMQPEKSIDYWLSREDKLPGDYFKGLMKMRVGFAPPPRTTKLQFDARGQTLAAELYERLETVAARLGLNKNDEYTMIILKNNQNHSQNDGEYKEEDIIKRSDRLGDVHTENLRVMWVPKHCKIIFVNYFDGREYPVTMNNRVSSSKIVKVAQSIASNSVLPTPPSSVKVFTAIPKKLTTKRTRASAVTRATTGLSAETDNQEIKESDDVTTPCKGHSKKKLYIVSQAVKGKCTLHYVFGTEAVTVDKVISQPIDPPFEVDDGTTEADIWQAAVNVAVARGYIKEGDQDPDKVSVFFGDGQKVDPSNTESKFCELYGDVLLRVVSNVQAPEAQVVFRARGGGNTTRSVVLPLDTPLKVLYQNAVRLLGVKFLPPTARERYVRDGHTPSLEEMEQYLNVKLFLGNNDNAITMADGTIRSISGTAAPLDNRTPVNITAEFFTRSGGDWESCVVYLVIGFVNKEMASRVIPPMTLVLDSSQTYADLYSDVRRRLSRWLSGDELNRVVIKSSNGDIIYGERDSSYVCKLGGKHLLVELLSPQDYAELRTNANSGKNRFRSGLPLDQQNKYQPTEGDFKFIG
jgi:hypothetical protein